MKRRLFLIIIIVLINLTLGAENEPGNLNNTINSTNSSNQTNISPSSPELPLPIVEFKSYYFINEPITINASKSAARANAKINNYSWEQASGNPVKICPCKLRNRASISVGSSMAGTYVFYLTVDDGVKSQPYKVSFEVVNKYSLISDLKLPDNILEYKGNKIYSMPLSVDKTGNYKFKIVTEGNAIVHDGITVKLNKDTYYLFTYNESTKVYKFENREE